MFSLSPGRRPSVQLVRLVVDVPSTTKEWGRWHIDHVRGVTHGPDGQPAVVSGRPGLCQASSVLGLAIACVVSADAWVYLLAAHGRYWLTGQRLPASNWELAGERELAADREPAADGWPAVTPVVPARNEAHMLPVTLPALLGQAYPGEFRVVLVDDRSDYGTGEIATELGVKSARDGGAPLTVLAGQPRPEGWAGKVWAMAQGVAAVAPAAPAYVLF